jgi:RNA polymerase sigma factor (sigma-70 family)
MAEMIDYLRSAVLASGETQLTDGELLDCFVSHRDRAAVAALVRRHAQMVWSVCWRILRDHHDAEDAFQATFLVLVRKAPSIKPREMIVNWLYGVAHQTARKARATLAKRRAREKQVQELPEPEAQSAPAVCSEIQPLLDQELSRLPDKYRVAIVMCDLEGATQQEAARQLKIPEGTLTTRLMRARRMLARRLAWRGLAVACGSVEALLHQNTAFASAPASAVSLTIKVATSVAAGKTAAAGLISANVTALTEGVVRAMLFAKLKNITLALVLAVVIALTNALLVAGGPTKEGNTNVAKKLPQAETQPADGLTRKAPTPPQQVQPEPEKPKGLEGFYRLEIEAHSKSGLTKGVGYAINFHADEKEVLSMFTSDVLTKWRGLVTGIALRHRDDVFDPVKGKENAKKMGSEVIAAAKAQGIVVGDGEGVPAIQVFGIDLKDNKKGRRLYISFSPKDDAPVSVTDGGEYQAPRAQEINGDSSGGYSRPKKGTFSGFIGKVFKN